MFQGIHQYHNPQGRIQAMQYLSLSYMHSKFTQDYNFNHIYIYDTLEIGDKPALIDTIECINK